MRDRFRTGALLRLVQLRWFIRLRWAFALTATGALGLEYSLARTTDRLVAFVVTLIVIALVNVVWAVFSRDLLAKIKDGDTTHDVVVRHAFVFANAQVAADLALLTVLIRFTGGVESPLPIFYLFHMVIGALVLKRWHAILQGTWAFALYAAVCFGEGWEIIVPHYAFLPSMAAEAAYLQIDYVMKVIAVVGAGIYGALYLTIQVVERLDEREFELRRTVSALQEAQSAIEKLQNRRARFMRTAAHQLKSPLAVVQTLGGLIRDGVARSPDEIANICGKIVRRCREGIDSVSDLLTLARVQESANPETPEPPTDMGEVIEDVVRQSSPLAEEQRIAVAVQVDSSMPLLVDLSRRDACDCIANLLENAVKYSKPDNTVTIEACRADGGVRVAVKDSGMGIDQATQETMFEAYRRGNEALGARISGSGLGLAIVREIMEQAKGRIHVDSTPGVGSTFTLWLPGANRQPPVTDHIAGSAPRESDGPIDEAWSGT